MQFKTKELLIQSIPEEEIGDGRWGFPVGDCGAGPSFTVTCMYCSNAPSACHLYGLVPVYCFESGAADPYRLKRLQSLEVRKAHLNVSGHSRPLLFSQGQIGFHGIVGELCFPHAWG